MAHREELLTQARNQISRFAPDLTVSIEQGSSIADPEADVIIASVPTLGRSTSGEARLQRFDPAHFKAIIIDEAHHSVTDTYLRILDHFGVLDGRNEHILLWGCSATLSRFDELALGDVYEEVTFHKDLSSMINEGWLCPFETYQIVTNIDLGAVKMRTDFDTTDLSLAINTPVRNDLVAGTWKSVAQEQHNRKATIVFALNISHVNGLLEAFNKIDIKAEAITSLTEEAEREDILLRFKNGQVPVLINCAVLTEGTDLPITDCILMTRPTCNANLYVQMVGRGLRRHPDKTYCLILDVIDKQRTGERTLITCPNLLAFKSSQVSEDFAEEKTPDELLPRGSPKTELSPDGINIEVRYFNPISFRPSTTLSWITLSDTQFLISSRSTNYLLTITDPASLACKIEEYRVDAAEIEVIPVLSQEGFHVKEAMSKFYQLLKDNKQYHEFLSFAHWRRISPPSQQQIRVLARIMRDCGDVQIGQFHNLYRWTVGKASSVISKYLFMTRVLKTVPKSWDDLCSGIKNY